MLSIKDLPYPPIGYPVKLYQLPEPLFLEQWKIPKGTIIKLRQTNAFGYCILPKGCVDERGFRVPQKLFVY